MAEPTQLDELAYAWEVAKMQEATANEKRRDVERQLVELLGCKTEGSKSHKTTWCSVKVEGKLTRKLDYEHWKTIECLIPSELNPVVFKPDISTTKLRKLEKENEEAYKTMLSAIETKPAKPYIRVERLKVRT